MNAHIPTPSSVKPLNTRQLAKAATRAKVLSSAKACFDADGYERADMRTIAAWACVSTGAIFGHFSGKAALYREVYGHDPISPEVGRELLGALKRLVWIRDWMIEVGGACEGPMPRHLLQEAAERQAVAIPTARAAIALATTPSEGSGVSVADSGGTASPKSDNHNHSEGAR